MQGEVRRAVLGHVLAAPVALEQHAALEQRDRRLVVLQVGEEAPSCSRHFAAALLRCPAGLGLCRRRAVRLRRAPPRGLTLTRFSMILPDKIKIYKFQVFN